MMRWETTYGGRGSPRWASRFRDPSFLISNTWSLEGEDFSRFLLQPIFNYNLAGGWYLTSVPIMTADWEADDDAWTVPVGGGFGKLHRFGKLPVNLQFQAFYNAEKPKDGPDWSTRFQIQFLFPR